MCAAAFFEGNPGHGKAILCGGIFAERRGGRDSKTVYARAREKEKAAWPVFITADMSKYILY